MVVSPDKIEFLVKYSVKWISLVSEKFSESFKLSDSSVESGG